MTTPGQRRTISVATLAAAAVAVLIMAVWGVDAATAPIPDDEKDTSADTSTGPDCPVSQQTVVEFVRRGEITVSVYNASPKAGLAGDTMDKLEAAGFRVGAIGNAPEGMLVDRAEVHTKEVDKPEAELVALALGNDTQVVVDEENDLGPGIDIYVGKKFRKLDPDAPRQLKLPEAKITCS